MAGAKLVKTRWPGIYRRGARYAYEWTDALGKRRRGSARTIEEARAAKGRREDEARHGASSDYSRATFNDYATEWVERYQGRGRRGFRDSTRDDYRRLLELYALRYFGPRLRLAELTPRHVAQFIAWMCDPKQQNGRALADSTVRNALNPVRACLATAVQEGLLRQNPTIGASLPHRPRVDDEEEAEVRALSTEQLDVLLRVMHPEYHTLFALLASTGLRVSEAFALQWRHLRLDGSRPVVKVRRALVRGRFGPPKSRYGRRDVPLSEGLVHDLRARRARSEWHRDDDLVFTSQRGTPLLMENVRRRHLRPAAEEAGVPWAGFHSFRHTAASRLFAAGRNAVQVQRWLGHHSPAFTLATYVHLLDDDLGPALETPTGTGSSLTPLGFDSDHGATQREDLSVDRRTLV